MCPNEDLAKKRKSQEYLGNVALNVVNLPTGPF
jgi:hypothetical protein